ncbi:hypothetical protein TRFO_15312 [Tritrichomonas foetus]|uniref:Uncharacterized protein n=1 Tax=Tritrichomonas foetus TaxID=1144522 RepID=A0A1J4KTC1_9EUKA|nr:hypothetical protein TRFO_15312 [Tritrichomonas foetus]|eukprot:OHT14378.1 hypothetical protein TRFO_15312 [Tritrichomonas foetus]
MTREFSIFRMTKKEWDSAKIGVKTDGLWMTFTDPKTREKINVDRQKTPDARVFYRHKKPKEKDPPPEQNPLVSPPPNNYNEFRARKQLHPAPQKKSKKKVIVLPRDYDKPNNYPKNFIFGDDPRRNPLARSATAVHEMRREEEIQKIINIRIERDKSRSVMQSRPSLFERSVTPREIQYRWPRDFSRFSVE